MAVVVGVVVAVVVVVGVVVAVEQATPNPLVIVALSDRGGVSGCLVCCEHSRQWSEGEG